MQLIFAIIPLVISSYFLLAVFKPALRPRWGKMSIISIYPPAPRKSYRKPVMGGLSCLGIGGFLGGGALLCFLSSDSEIPSTVAKVVLSLMLCGFVLGIIGQFRDKALSGCGAWVPEADEAKRGKKHQA